MRRFSFKIYIDFIVHKKNSNGFGRIIQQHILIAQSDDGRGKYYIMGKF